MLFNDYSEGKQNKSKVQFPEINDTADVALFDFLNRTKEISEENETPFFGYVFRPETDENERKSAVAAFGGITGPDIMEAYEAINKTVFDILAKEIGPVSSYMLMQTIFTKSIAESMSNKSNVYDTNEDE